jgi:ABC-type multidrug transport system fused ATPase/permease subunit
VTNALNFLADCDRVIMLDKGVIVEMGTYKELVANKSKFSDFVGKYFQNTVESKET